LDKHENVQKEKGACQFTLQYQAFPSPLSERLPNTPQRARVETLSLTIVEILILDSFQLRKWMSYGFVRLFV